MSDYLQMSGFTGALGKAGLAEGTAAATIQVLAPNGAGLDFAIDGIAYHKADTDSIALTAHPQQAVASTCLYLVQLSAAGVLSTKQGNVVLTANLAREAAQWPQPDEDRCPIGGYKIATDGSTTFTNGTTDNGAAGITDTYYDFAAGLPLAPQVA